MSAVAEGECLQKFKKFLTFTGFLCDQTAPGVGAEVFAEKFFVFCVGKDRFKRKFGAEFMGIDFTERKHIAGDQLLRIREINV